MPPHTVAASAWSLRFLELSTRLLRTFTARSLRTNIALTAHACRAVDASAPTFAASAPSPRFLNTSAHGAPDDSTDTTARSVLPSQRRVGECICGLRPPHERDASAHGSACGGGKRSTPRMKTQLQSPSNPWFGG